MAETTGIEWADKTANFWIGCTKVSPGCDLCYAERDWGKGGIRARVTWGPHGERSPVKQGPSDIRKWNKLAERHGGVDPELGRRARVFINSLSDIFDNHRSISDDLRASGFALMEESRFLIFMLVTKRPQNIVKMVPAHWLDPGGWPENVWVYVSTENQEEADRRIPILLAVPGIRVRGVSAGPLLGPLFLLEGPRPAPNEPHSAPLTGWRGCDAQGEPLPIGPKINHVLCEGESGKGARDNDFAANARSLRDQCAAAGVPFFMKQMVKKAPIPDDLMVREFPA